MSHPFATLDEIVHQRSRLGILSLLRSPGQLEFRALRDELELTDGNLSQHLRTLEGAGYVTVRKGYEGRRPRTWVRLTKAGDRALEQELEVLRQIIEGTQTVVVSPAVTARQVRPAAN
jgi:DNA-binding MarR family transcriptional regulator